MRAKVTLKPIMRMRANAKLKPIETVRTPNPKEEFCMQYDLKTLKLKHDKQPVTECVDIIKRLKGEMDRRGEELVGLLWYLEKTKRWQEHEGYKKLSFNVFVSEVCAMTYNQYRQLAYAYNWYPEEAREFGPKVVQAVRSRVGVLKMPKVLGEIKQKASAISDPLKKREAIYQVIERHSPKTEPKDNKEVEDWERKYNNLLVRYKALEKENEKLREQLERQKGPVKAFLAMKEAAKPMMQAN